MNYKALISFIIFNLFTFDTVYASRKSSCAGTGNAATCVVVDDEISDKTLPAVYTADGGNSWQLLPEHPYLGRYYLGVDCKQHNMTIYCLAVGTDVWLTRDEWIYIEAMLNYDSQSKRWSENPTGYNHIPRQVSCLKTSRLCIVGTNETTHLVKDIGELGYRVVYLPFAGQAYCHKGKNEFCLGHTNGDRNAASVIYKSNDIASQTSWQGVPIQAFPQNSSDIIMNDKSCTATGLCVVVGQYLNDHSKVTPFFAQSNDYGETWVYKNIVPVLTRGSLSSVSCASNTLDKSRHIPTNTICVVVGSKKEKNVERPLLVQTQDNGVTWEEKSFSELSQLGHFNTVLCSATEQGISCLAGGQNDDSNSNAPLFVQSDNTGIWRFKQIQGNIDAHSEIHTISCADDNKLCIAAGNIFAISKDGGATWNIINPSLRNSR